MLRSRRRQEIPSIPYLMLSVWLGENSATSLSKVTWSYGHSRSSQGSRASPLLLSSTWVRRKSSKQRRSHPWSWARWRKQQRLISGSRSRMLLWLCLPTSMISSARQPKTLEPSQVWMFRESSTNRLLQLLHMGSTSRPKVREMCWSLTLVGVPLTCRSLQLKTESSRSRLLMETLI